VEERLAGGKLLLDQPAEAVTRLTIANPARRNALDHEILDAFAEVLPRLDRGIESRCVLITGAAPLFSDSCCAGFVNVDVVKKYPCSNCP